MKFYDPAITSHPLHAEINALYLADESEVVAALLKEATLPAGARDRIAERARALVIKGTFKRLIQRSGEPVIRQAVNQAMRILGRQFVMGRTINEALERARSAEAKGYSYSYDMLGEAARTAADAERYLQAYSQAIDTIGKAANGRGHIAAPGISVKLSALHPRYE